MITNFKDAKGVDLGDKLVPKSYLIDRYPELVDNIRSAGLWAWGKDDLTGADPSGALGLTVAAYRSSPTQIAGTDWKLVYGTQTDSSFAIKTDNTLWSWGRNWDAILGLNIGDVRSSKSSPVQVGTDTNWKSIAANYQTAALKTDGTLWTWGHNSYGGLGVNDCVHRSSPVQVAGTDWKFAIPQVAIKTDGTLWAWGYNLSGNLGLNDRINRSSPTQIAGTNWKIVSGIGGVLGLKTDNTLWVWGSNSEGQLGINICTNKSSPVQVGTESNWKQISRGTISAAIKTDGTLWTWGYNYWGTLGISDCVHRSSPVQVAGTNWKNISAGIDSVAAIKTDGTLWTWSYGFYGETGVNDQINRSSPVQIIGTSWTNISAGNGFILAIRDNGDDFL